MTMKISIFDLKKWGYLDVKPICGGFLKWKKEGVTIGSIRFYILQSNKESFIRLLYSIGKEMVSFDIEFLKTNCNYGGYRLWFKCPALKWGNQCGKRVGILYDVGDRFACRDCANIVYFIQVQGGKFRKNSVYFSDIDELEKQVKIRFYNGKPTRKYRRLLRLKEMLQRDISYISKRIKG